VQRLCNRLLVVMGLDGEVFVVFIDQKTESRETHQRHPSRAERYVDLRRAAAVTESLTEWHSANTGIGHAFAAKQQ
jgi:hypothetical protein